jgi:hypothetical protein
MANVGIPVIERKVNAQESSIPDFQSAFEELGKSQNSLSAIGAQVAQSASNQMASQLGYESGKNPHGDLFPPITDFDKQFSDSYHAQASATLSQQGQKLLDDADIEMAKSPRLSSNLISRTNQQVQLGLNKIVEMAPTAIKTSLSNSFNSSVLQQTNKFKLKMISDQKEDQKNNLLDGIESGNKNVLQFGISGDSKGATTAANTANKLIDNALANRFITPQDARSARDTVKQTLINGQQINLGMAAYKQDKFAEWEKLYADKKIPGTESMTNEQWVAAGKAVHDQVGFVQGLKQQDENLTAQNMVNQIAANPNSITDTDWTTFKNKVSPQLYEKVQHTFIQAMKKGQSQNAGTDFVTQHWSNPEAHANAKPEVVNSSFKNQVTYAMQNGNLNSEDAEVQVAANAGAAVPLFTKEIQNKIYSGQPTMMASAARQIHSLRQLNATQALKGLSDKDLVVNDTFKALLDQGDAVKAGQEAVATVNQDPDVQTAMKQLWSSKLHVATSGGVPLTTYALTTFGLKTSDFMNPSAANVYGADILKKYGALFQLSGGNDNIAKTATQRYIDDNYGDTGVNGGSFKTMHPIEKVLGYSDPGVVPYIQQDAINQLNAKMAPVKKMYDEGKSNVYFETLPLTSNKPTVFGKLKSATINAVTNPDGNYTTPPSSYNPIQVRRHLRLANGTQQVDTYNCYLLGNDFNWDIALDTKDGLRNIAQKAPFLGIHSYTPNAKAIHDSYYKDHALH